ncbi:MAG: hypothetical protein IKK21_10755 [Clostridia bacterium]|nr:hypothetical protein [Clostridia bacterium]
MKKYVFALLVVLCVAFCAAACAQTFTFPSIYATVSVDDEDMILLTPTNLALHQEWVARQGMTEEELIAAWEKEGVLLVAESTEGDVRLVISAVQDEDAKQYFDLDQQSTKSRTAFRTAHTKGAYYKSQGYTYQSAEWKKGDSYGRFLSLKYKRTVDGKTYRGYARRTIRNGYTITLDYQVYGRTLQSADSRALSRIMDTFAFTSIKEKPATAVGKVNFTSVAPTETNTGKFTVEGTCDPGIKLTGVVMRMSSMDQIIIEETANKSGKFSMDVELPTEGVWLMTVTVENGEIITEEIVFDTTTYQKTLLPVNFDEEIEANVEGNTLTISGKTLKNTTVQCMVGTEYDKLIKTNGTGKFSFKIDTKKEGVYEIIITFQKKNYNTRRFTFTTTRTLTDAQRKQQIRDEAVKPAYSTLTDKLTGYTGRTMGYTLHVVDMNKVGNEWILTMAMKKTSKGYSNLVVVVTEEEPNFSIDSEQKMYGVCAGAYVVTDGEKETSYPSFDLLFWD